jgi:hypothetical protein
MKTIAFIRLTVLTIWLALTAFVKDCGAILNQRIFDFACKHGFILTAKVNGPMFSLSASGKFADALVFTSWKGRPVVRQLVTPANPQSVDQQVARNIVRIFGTIQNFVNRMAALFPAKRRDGRANTDKDDLITAAPAGQAWNGNLMKVGIGAAQINYDAAVAAWGGVTDKTAWTTAAGVLSVVIPEVAQIGADGVPEANMAAGEVYFIYVYTLYLMGLSALKDEVPPVWA